VKLSICICTFDRPAELRRALDTLMAGTRQPDEVLVSDDSPDPEPTRAVCARHSIVRYMRGPGAGLPAKRNQLIDEATGTHIHFPDDDVTFPPGFVAAAYAAMERMDTRTILTGYTIDHHPDGRTEVVPPHDPDFWGLQRLQVSSEPRSLSMNAAIFPAAVFDVLRFDNRLTYGAEEIDFARRLLVAGFRIEYTDELYTHHHPPAVRRDYQTRRVVNGLRLFATGKAYWGYERAPLKAAAYAVLAPLQLLGNAMRTRDRAALREAVAAIGLAARLTLAAAARRARSIR
jgi:GT2 family glycosyltransferase